MEEPSYLSPQEKAEWSARIAEASRNNVLCHCQQCDRQWMASKRERCACGSGQVEAIFCWQFPDD